MTSGIICLANRYTCNNTEMRSIITGELGVTGGRFGKHGENRYEF